MKKIILVGLAVLGSIALTGCSFLESLMSGADNVGDPEKQYNYAEFKALLADRNLSFTMTKCNSVIDVDGEKTNREYTYQKADSEHEDDGWHYSYTTKVLGEDVEMNGVRNLDIVNYIKTADVNAALLDKKTDDLFKFYAKSDSYRITATYEDSKQKAEAEYKYGKDGLMTYSYEKNIDLEKVTSKVTTETFSYSA